MGFFWRRLSFLILAISIQAACYSQNKKNSGYTRVRFEQDVNELVREGFIPIFHGRDPVYEVPSGSTMFSDPSVETFSIGLNLEGEVEKIQLNATAAWVVVLKKNGNESDPPDMKIICLSYPDELKSSKDAFLVEEYVAWLKDPRTGKGHLAQYWIHKNVIFILQTRKKDFSVSWSKACEAFRANVLNGK